jgi:hypothetical protein
VFVMIILMCFLLFFLQSFKSGVTGAPMMGLVLILGVYLVLGFG